MDRSPENPVLAYIGLGSNLDDPLMHLRSGVAALTQLYQTRVELCSSLYRTAPVGNQDQPDFINAVCRVRTDQTPATLMRHLLQIERAHGRVREGKKGGPRTLDLDLLLYGSRVIETEDLMVPHPRLHERAFVLYPLHEIEPDLIIPGRGALRTLLANCIDQRVEKVAVV